MNKEVKTFLSLLGIFIFFYFVPFSHPKVTGAIYEAFRLLQWYVREHTLPCVVPAMFIAGGISTFLSQASVMRYLGPNANRVLAYTIGSVAGVILAVCSCSVLPLFAGIYAMGAGIGPACAFLYSGPAINVIAIFLTPRVLGLDLGIARVIGSVAFAFIIGLLMAAIFRREEQKRVEAVLQMPEPPPSRRRLWQTTLYFVCMVLFLVFSDWFSTNDVTITMKDGTVLKANVRYQTADTIDVQEYLAKGKLSPEVRRINKADVQKITPVPSLIMSIHEIRWYLAGLMGLAVLIMLWRWFSLDEVKQWLSATWDFSKMIIPLLFGGVFVTGFISALIPEKLVAGLVGSNTVFANFFASILGAMWYFATLTEIPITQALMNLGMAKGPALTLLLAGPAVSIPSYLVLRKIMGDTKTAVFVGLKVVMSALVGLIFGMFF